MPPSKPSHPAHMRGHGGPSHPTVQTTVRSRGGMGDPSPNN